MKTYLQNIKAVFFSLQFFVACSILSAQNINVNFSADTISIFPNPERGWRQQAMPDCCDNPPLIIHGPHTPFTVSKLLLWRNSADAVTVFKDDVKIQEWTSDIPQSRLDEIQADFNTIRKAGLKSIFRIVYNWGMGTTSPEEAQILRHIEQLKPVISLNADVICAFEFGTFGGTGEAVSGNYIDMTGNNGSQALTPAAIRVYKAIAEMVPADRMLPIHYPRYKLDMMGWEDGNNWPASAKLITTENAFDGSLQSRIGFYDDNFAGDENHWGFFNGWPYHEKKMVANDGLYVYTEGELSGATDYNKTNGERELKKYRFSAYQQSGDGGADVIKAWKSSGQYDRIARNLGYRFRLISASIPQILPSDSTLSMSINMVNDGYTRIMNPRKVEIIFRNKSTGEKFVIDIDGDGRGNRLWLPGPGETKTLSIVRPLPDNIPVGVYDLFLNLPDPYPSLHDRPEYSIRLANHDVWEDTTGYNVLYKGLEITPYNEVKTLKFESKNFTIYPNPFSDSIHLTFKENLKGASVRITNSVGQIIFQQSFTQEFTWNGKDWNGQKVSEGVFVFSVVDNASGELVFSEKIICKR